MRRWIYWRKVYSRLMAEKMRQITWEQKPAMNKIIKDKRSNILKEKAEVLKELEGECQGYTLRYKRREARVLKDRARAFNFEL